MSFQLNFGVKCCASEQVARVAQRNAIESTNKSANHVENHVEKAMQ